ncbi:MAG: heterodisulfide reductase-related iron-sulfur binding cluster [Methanobrevibacter sp.]
MSKNRIKQAEDTECDLIVTACPFCKLNLSSNSENLKVIDLSEFVAKALKKEDM